MANSRREHFRKTRASRLRDLKRSGQGIVAMIAAILSFILFVMSVIKSFMENGEGPIEVGSIALIGFVSAAGALVMGILAIREPKVRLLAPRTGIVLGAVMAIVLGALFASGL